MTKQQIRDEHKETEGSPEAKQHIRQKQRAILSRSMRKAVESVNGELHAALAGLEAEDQIKIGMKVKPVWIPLPEGYNLIAYEPR